MLKVVLKYVLHYKIVRFYKATCSLPLSRTQKHAQITLMRLKHKRPLGLMCSPLDDRTLTECAILSFPG